MTNKQQQKAKTGGRGRWGGGGVHHSQISEIKFAKAARGYSGTLNEYREEGVKTFVTRCVHTKYHPFSPNKSTSLPLGFA